MNFRFVTIGLSVFLSLAAVPAQSATPICFIDPEPIHAQYRAMLGRNATGAEQKKVTAIIASGYPWAYFEPYPTYAPYNHKSPNDTCNSWVGLTDSPKYAGIPFQHGTEWATRGKDDAVDVTTLYRVYFCDLPKKKELAAYLKFYRQQKSLATSGFDAVAAGLLASKMRADAPVGTGPCSDVLDEASVRVLGRPAEYDSSCEITSATEPDVNTPDPDRPGSVNGCYWLWQLANGRISLFDLAHGLRSTQEALTRNENPDCYSQYSVTGTYAPTFSPNFRLNPLLDDEKIRTKQNDAHAIGEYIRQVYRVFLGRQPQCLDKDGVVLDCGAQGVVTDELAQEVGSYPAEGGDPRPFLHDLADRIVNPRTRGPSARSKYGEYKALCAARARSNKRR